MARPKTTPEQKRAVKEAWYLLNRERLTEKARSWALEHPEKRRIIELRRDLKRYGLSIEDYERLEKEQHEVCKICLEWEPRHRLVVDHCHKTRKVRGLLCHRCNLALGMVKDDIKWLQNMVEYLHDSRR